MKDRAIIPKKGESIFVYLSTLFEKHGVRSLLVGGYALAANRLQRMTYDIDFIVTAGDFAKMENSLIAADYSVFNRQPAFVQLKSNRPGLRDIDFLISDPGTLDELFSQGREVSIAGKNFTVPSPLHLIAMKLHAIAQNPKRELKDWPDVVELMTANGIDPREQNVLAVFKKQVAEVLYNKTVAAVRSRNGKK